EVPLPPKPCRHVEPVVVAQVCPLRGGYQGAPDLGREHVLLPRAVGERRTEALLGQPEPVVRRGVEVPDPRFPGRVDGLTGLLVRGPPVQVAELSSAETQLRQTHTGPHQTLTHVRALRSRGWPARAARRPQGLPGARTAGRVRSVRPRRRP